MGKPIILRKGRELNSDEVATKNVVYGIHESGRRGMWIVVDFLLDLERKKRGLILRCIGIERLTIWNFRESSCLGLYSAGVDGLILRLVLRISFNF